MFFYSADSLSLWYQGMVEKHGSSKSSPNNHTHYLWDGERESISSLPPATPHQVLFTSWSSFQLLWAHQLWSNFCKRICSYEEWSEKDLLETMAQSANISIINILELEKWSIYSEISATLDSAC